MNVQLYQFTVKEGAQETFEKNWRIVTEAIKRTRGSLGSRLHTTEVPLTYIGYAQWPSKEVFQSGIGNDLFTEEEREALKIMKESCQKIDTLHSMTVCDDRSIPGHPGHMKVFVKNVSGKVVVIENVSPSDTTKEIEKKLNESFERPNDFQLYFGSHKLEEDDSMERIGVTNESTLHFRKIVHFNADIVFCICTYLPPMDLARVTFVSKLWKSISDSVWAVLVDHPSIKYLTFRHQNATPKQLCIQSWPKSTSERKRMRMQGLVVVSSFSLDPAHKTNFGVIFEDHVISSSGGGGQGGGEDLSYVVKGDSKPSVTVRGRVMTELAIEPGIDATFGCLGPENNFFLFGGWNYGEETSVSSIVSFDFDSLQWRRVSSLPQPRCFCAATMMVDGRILVVGGGNSPWQFANVSNEVLLYDLRATSPQSTVPTRDYSPMGSPPSSSSSEPQSHCQVNGLEAMGIDTGKVVNGCVIPSNKHNQSCNAEGEPAIKMLPPLLGKRCGHGVVTLFNDSAVAVGGYDGVNYLSTAELLVSGAERWLPLPAMGAQRSGVGVGLGPCGSVYAAGGSCDGHVGLSSCERLDVIIVLL